MIKFIDYNDGKYELKNGKSGESIFVEDLEFADFVVAHKKEIDLQFFADLFKFSGAPSLNRLTEKVFDELIAEASEKQFVKFYTSLPDDRTAKTWLLLKRPKLCVKFFKADKLDVRNVLGILDVVSLPMPESKKIKYFMSKPVKLMFASLPMVEGEDYLLLKKALKLRSKEFGVDEFFKYCELLAPNELTVAFYKKHAHQLDEFSKYALLAKIVGYDKRAEKLMKRLKLDNNVKDMLMRVRGLEISEHGEMIRVLTSSQIIKNLGADNVYNIIKYGVLNNDLPDMTNLLADPETFKKYCEYRKLNLQQAGIQPKRFLEAIEEFSKHYDLIKTCVNEDLSENEKTILASAVKEEFKINDRNDLKNYTQKRTEYINSLIETNISSAITYIFSKMFSSEFKEKEKLFFNDKQLEASLNDFNKELGRKVELINTAKQLKHIIESLDRDKQVEALKHLVEDLENEFSPQGSHFASLRNSFSSFEKDVQKLYGEELANSLQKASNNLPQSEKIDDVDVHKLKGEKFTLLIHGLNAYGGGGTADAWTNRERGKTYLCTSLISNNHLGKAGANIYYGFSDISSDALLLEGATDIMSRDKMPGSLDVTAGRGVHFSRSEDLLEETKNNYFYNEVVLRREQFDENGKAKPITPDYIVAFDKISELDNEEAQRLNIPIVFIDTKIYAQQIEAKNAEKKALNEEAKENGPKKTLTELSHDEAMEIINGAHTKVDAIEQKKVIHEIKAMENVNNYEEGVNV